MLKIKKKFMFSALLLVLCMLFSACSDKEVDIKGWALGKYYEIDNTDEQNSKKGSLIYEITKSRIVVVGTDKTTKKTFKWGDTVKIVEGNMVAWLTYNFKSCSDDELVFEEKVDSIFNGTNTTRIVKRDGKFYLAKNAEDETEVIKE